MTTTRQPADEAPVRLGDTPVPPSEGPPPDPVDSPVQGFERRLEDVVDTIREFAALHFEARAPLGPDGDIVDAVAAGSRLRTTRSSAGSPTAPRSSRSPRRSSAAERFTTA